MLQVEHKVVKGRVLPVHAVEVLRPAAAVGVRFLDVGNRLAAAEPQSLLGHADSKLDRRDNSQSQDGDASAEEQMAGVSMIDSPAAEDFLGEGRLHNGEVDVLPVVQGGDRVGGRLLQCGYELLLGDSPDRRAVDDRIAINATITQRRAQTFGQQLAAAERSSGYGND